MFARYILPILPVLCLFAAVAVEWTAALASRRAGWRREPVFALLVAQVMLPSLAGSAHLVVLLGRTDSRIAAFFLPLRNLWSVRRPGLNISIYRRNDVS